MHTPPMYLPEPRVLAEAVAGRYAADDELRAYPGYMNYTIVVGQRLVVKVPSDDDPQKRWLLNREQAALRLMEGVDIAPFTAPGLIECSQDPAYLVASYVPGNVMTPGEISALPCATRERLGRSIGAFVARLSAATSPGIVDEQIPELGQFSWPSIFDRYITNFSLPDYPALSHIAEDLRERWQEYDRRLGSAALYPIHGDIFPQNLAFNSGFRLQGAFDYARMHTGTLAEECSPLIDGDPVLFANFLSELQAAGLPVAVEDIQLWRDMKDFHVLPHWILNNNTAHPYFVTIRDNFAKCYPHLDWSGLYRP